MAKYNRKLLVSYLQDVCTAETLCTEASKELIDCQQEIAQHRAQIDQLTQSSEQKLLPPSAPNREDYEKKAFHCMTFTIASGAALLLGCTLVLFCISGASPSLFIDFLALALVVGGGFFTFGGLSDYISASSNAKRNYENALKLHQAQIEIYHSQVRQQAQDSAELPKITAIYNDSMSHQAVLEKRLRNAQELRSSVYSVNIIPSIYRNKYVAFYLYDYFRTSRETDLDKIIQTLLLDEIKQQLGQIIDQTGQILINQRIQIALQEAHNQEEAELHREEMKRTAQIEQNLELQADYQKMILENQKVTNYILAADYLYKGGPLPNAVKPYSKDLPPLPSEWNW